MVAMENYSESNSSALLFGLNVNYECHIFDKYLRIEEGMLKNCNVRKP
jgi:hypothetical protein